jgi:pyruvate/2-oxoglutarate dehydrogenase complex dihydrolipoamide acyltransferase (E2) component
MIEITLANDAWHDVEPGTEALIEGWTVIEGDEVTAGQPIASVVVVKTNFEVIAPADGVIEKILVAAEETFAPGKPLALLKEAA